MKQHYYPSETKTGKKSLLPYIQTCNIIELNELIHIGTKFVCNNIGML